jgi:hypothetical protein
VANNFTAVSCILSNIYKSWHDLEFQDLISAVMIVNASSAMIRMTLSRKEILAACVLIIVIRFFFLKIFTLAAIGSTIAYITSRFDLFSPGLLVG